ncbi:MAG: MBL fold metallo-hydrolase [Dehalococcoidia bacterium]|nr:MBL fold metallo-hydrolase [Dehalococcoidia bacterium]
MEITPGVHRITDINGSNAVLIVDEQMAVVDTGISGNGESIVSYIKSIGRDPRDLRWILVTHFHFDHSGSAQELHELTGAKIVSHRAETELTSEGKSLLIKGNEGAEGPPKIYSWLMGRRGNKRTQEIKYHDTEVHETVEEDDVIPCLGGIRIMHTPGHTPGSICPVLEGPRVLFLGDSVLNNINRLSRPLMWDRNKRRELDTSLRRLRELDSDVAMFGHGPPLTDDVNNKVRGLTDRPYDLPTWKIVLKNWRTLRKWRETTSKPGHWGAGPK